MTKDEALKLALGYVERNCPALVFGEIKAALAQPTSGDYALGYGEGFNDACKRQPDERNFCPRCGKRTADLTTIHTCTPPQENT
jgi:hypothetical protein